MAKRGKPQARRQGSSGTPVWAWLLIGLFGFTGFVATAAIERDLGVRESGHFLPGHGGLLERLDSLIFSAPLFFHFVYDQFY